MAAILPRPQCVNKLVLCRSYVIDNNNPAYLQVIGLVALLMYRDTEINYWVSPIHKRCCFNGYVGFDKGLSHTESETHLT